MEMENDKEKRRRSPNWLPSEKHLLLDLVEEHFGVIENKKTDGITCRKKQGEWSKIQDEYNARTVNCSRSANTLKAQWECLKKSARKEAAQNKSWSTKTGGGPPNSKKDDIFFLRIISLIKTTAVGLCNPFDSDNVEASGSQDITDSRQIIVENMDVVIQTDDNSLDDNIDKIQKDDLGIEVSDKEDVQEKADDGCDKDWGDYTPSLLKMPVSTLLRVKAKTNTSGAEKKKSWVSRRRPILGVSPTSSLVDQLHMKKIEALEVQMKLAYEEREEMKKLNAIEAELKKEKIKQERIVTRNLLLDLKLKKLQFKINDQQFRTSDGHLQQQRK